jgi:hypothetical protein
MDEQEEFFKKGGTSLATFYPTHYIVAAYPTRADADAAAKACRKNGFADDDVRVLDGDFVLGRIEAREEDANWIERVKRQLAQFAGTESDFVDEDAAFAQTGGAFLYAYAPDDEAVERARRVFARHGPVYARRYLRLAIEIIVQNPEAI